MRAVAVVTNEFNNVSGFLFPGSHVDVLVSFHPHGQHQRNHHDGFTERRSAEHRREAATRSEGKPQNVKVVTVLLRRRMRKS